MDNLTREIVKSIHTAPKYDQLDEETKSHLKKGLLDYFICCYSTVEHEPNFKNVLKTAIYTGHGETSIIGSTACTYPFDACLINGYSAHALDLDDVHSEIRGHPSAVILSLLLSLTEQHRKTNRFYEAYLIGIEMMTRVSRLLGTKHYEKGFHTTATAGLYGAVSAGAYYLDFSLLEFSQSLDLCVSQISGSRSHFGTVIKPLHAGLAAQKAWQILHFVKSKVTGNENTIVSKNGLLSMYGENKEDANKFFADWGDHWAVDRPGLWFKLYPCCSANAHVIDAAKEIMKNHTFIIDDIEHINLYFPPNGDAALVYRMPENGEEGRFSAEYCVALLLQNEDLSIENFIIESISEETKALIKKMTRLYDKNIPVSKNSYPKNRYNIVEIIMKNGVKHRSRIDVPYGSPGNPLNMEDLLEKANKLLKQKSEPLIKVFSAEGTVGIEVIMELLVK
ncbi:2-methylcitrate dehydratase PrpD [Scopulibacillus darangshiensis]|uniref:2-methylcitrate dehydratase PrpD n=1 Tax=Scopulibacillus darangshiensis TaxID=442528 RepID=A0A4R2NPL8_9BACL|nr:MmgE/PrpD family protein [Scopulibacillus darangshiensis]TCP23763.1 2-methylcitrate dehydratase PrpD [Scopulibacillus darangshiensis]